MIIQQEIFHIIKIIIKLLEQAYKGKQIKRFLKKLNFTIKLEENNGPIIFLITEKQQKAILNFSLDSLIVRE